MPIDVGCTIRACNQEEFHALDHRIMGVIFELHNEFGRLLDEELYKREIRARCLDIGLKPIMIELLEDWGRLSRSKSLSGCTCSFFRGPDDSAQAR